MSIILGLNCNHADSSACIIRDGELLFAVEEERINRIKHWAGLPCASIDACLKYTNIDLSDVTCDPVEAFYRAGFSGTSSKNSWVVIKVNSSFCTSSVRVYSNLFI